MCRHYLCGRTCPNLLHNVQMVSITTLLTSVELIRILVVCLGLFIALKCVKSQNQLPFLTMKFFHQLVSSQCYRRTSSHWWSRMNGSTNCIPGHKYAIETIQIFHLRHNYATKPVLLLDCGLKIKTPVVFCGGFVTVHKPFENWQSER